ncbi:UvrABC system protein B [Labeo rohita]|uniref:UvrABC system protein B n=1 Tax=Labeo rohita TaxID=84645 RepID=A0ABQ8MDS9_LABRO|nr:UvrABC system protein B [Labeo rohita]
MENIPQQHDVDKWPYLSEVKLPQIDAGVEILIGNKEYKLLEPWQVINSKHNGPYAVKTALGWILNGPLREPVEESMYDNKQASVTVNRISIESVEQMLIQQYNHDFPERNCDDKAEVSQEDYQFLDSVSNSLQFTDNHYYIGLPFKKAVIQMPNNRSAAMQRALNLKKKFKKKRSFHEEYSNFMNDMFEKGHAVKVPTPHLSRQDGQVWYIPHHGVYHPQKKKLRVVFDCAASYQGVSLNSELLQGPEEVAMMADVEAMYYQVRVPEKDTDLLSFLWWPNGDVNQNLVEYKMVVHLFGAKSSPSVANFALRKTAEENRSNASVEAVNTVLRNFYVDDCLKSVLSHDQAVALYNNLTNLCASGGFHLTKWASNSRALLTSIPESERVKDVRDLDLSKDALPVERALGVLWCVNSDMFKFKVSLKEQPVTRRGILSIASSIYDPLGFLAPVILPAKILMQQLCKEKLTWDDDIPEQFAKRWKAWLQELHQLSEFSVARCIKPVDFGVTTTAQLHHFSDASEMGYGVVSYLKLVNADGLTHCAFMMGKSRVAPLKQTTIPRMELTAAVVAVNTDKMLKSELEMELLDSIFWTDSTTVLRYIDNEKLHFKTFESTKPQQWRYVSTSQNPADSASRGVSCEKFVKNINWIHGPSFLKEPECKWPENIHDLSIKEDDNEIKHSASVNLVSATESTDAVSKLINYHSDWYKLKRSVAWILRVKDMLKQKTKKVERCVDDPMAENHKSLTIQDLTRAENEVIKFIQSQKFKEEISMLQKGNASVKRNSCLSKLDPVLQDGVLRVGGRLGRKIRAKAGEQKMSELPYDRVTPDHPPFTNVGVDYFGPFDVRQVDTDSCLNAIRRFVCRRGQVSIMRSDNGTNFIGAEVELRKAIQQWNQSKIECTLMQKGIQWIFNPPSGSHFGGIWERQISQKDLEICTERANTN